MAIRVEEIDGRTGCVDIDRDRLLVVRHQDGDGAAFDELYRRYHGRLVGYCHRRVGDRHVAEELAQEAFVKAFRAMPGFAGERRFYPWMTVIAQRLCIDYHRRSARVEPTAEVDAGSVEPEHDELWAAVDRRHLGTAIERLAPRHREILELREQRGWSYQAIAEHLDVPLTTVEALLHRARKALRREYLAVAGEDAAGRLAVLGGLGAVLVKAKGWLAALGPERLIPAIGTAAAGVAAVGAVVVPLAGPDAAEAEPVDVQASEPAPSTTAAPVATAAPATTVVVEAPTPPPAAQPSTVEVEAAPTTVPPEPPVMAEVGPITVYEPSEAAGDYGRSENVDAAIHLPLGELADIGLSPAELLDYLVGNLVPNVEDLTP